MIREDKIELINELLELMKNERLSKGQIIEMMNLVDRNEKATENQKERFCLYYGLNVNGRKGMNLTQIANIYGCTHSAIKTSISSMRIKLINYTNEFEYMIMKKIVNKCRMEMNGIG